MGFLFSKPAVQQQRYNGSRASSWCLYEGGAQQEIEARHIVTPDATIIHTSSDLTPGIRIIRQQHRAVGHTYQRDACVPPSTWDTPEILRRPQPEGEPCIEI